MRRGQNLHGAARMAAHGFYRLTISGPRVPRVGPVLLVANHPNSLLDPALVSAAARRPVRFLAKAPLLRHRAVGWLVRAAGAIPVYRPADEPGAAFRNADTFRAVHAALQQGAAVGIFPEGTTHNRPALVPFRTGAARIALGAAPIFGAFAVVPVGITLRSKDRFRSEALAIVGEPVPWADLAGRDDAAAVREFTARIEAALRQITVNLEQWEDEPLVAAAEAVYAVERGLPSDPAARVRRLHQATAALARLRAQAGDRWRVLAGQVEAHDRGLRALGIAPGDLHEPVAWWVAVRWTARRVAFWIVAGPVLAIGAAVFMLPVHLVRATHWLLRPSLELRATYKTLIGFVIFLVWTVAVTVLAAALRGATLGIGTLAGLPLLAVATLWLRDQWRDTWHAARGFVRQRRSGELRAGLQREQANLAHELQRLLEPEHTRVSEHR